MRTGFSMVYFEKNYLSSPTRKGKPSFFGLEGLRVTALLFAFGLLAVVPLSAGPLLSCCACTSGGMTGLDISSGLEKQALWKESTLGFSPARPETDTLFKNRKGFILGFGLGASLVIPKFKIGNTSISLDNKFAVVSDFKIGGAVNDQLMIYWSSKVSWYGMEDNAGDKTTFTFGQGGVGVTYFFSPESISAFVSGGLGFSSLGAPFDANVKPDYGFGFFLGGGYEFAKHFTVKGDLVWGNPGNSDFGEKISQNTLTLGVSVNYLLY